MLAFFYGLFSGLVFALSFGPAFAIILQENIHHAYPKTFGLIVGISLSDVLYATLGYFGFQWLLQSPTLTPIFSLGGGFLLIGYGSYLLLKKYASSTADEKKELNFIALVAKGFLVNGLNPMMGVFWIGILQLGTTTYQLEHAALPQFLTGMLLVSFLLDNLKSYLITAYKQILSPTVLILISRAVGASLVGFGTYFVLSLFFQ